ncbi:MAG TPA: OmpA family protein [Pyrinomonadaceae bacterium]|nr:OmpA family protein [Pyrinomonadaceae bacterium]
MKKPIGFATCSVVLASGLCAVFFACAQPVAGQEGSQVIDPSKNKILDLVFRVDDLGGKVQDLQVKETGQEIRIELAADVLFDFDKADLRAAAQKTLHQAAGIIQDKAKGAVRIEGHTDSKGNDAYNQKLSERRAASVKTWFVDKEGLGKVQFSTQGFGAKKPVASNTKPDGSDDPAGRQKNRRVEIIIRKS